MNKRILIVRTDRLGDVLLTTPVSRAIRQAWPQAYIAWLVKPYTASLFEHNPDVNEIIVDRGSTMGPLIHQIRERHFDAAVIAYPRWRTAWMTWRAQIPMRIGPASKPYSLLFSHRLWQHRSEGKKHETDYNLDLLHPLGLRPERMPTRLVLTDEERATARKTLEGMRLSFQKPIVLLHPGSGGSSSRWPLTHFMELGDRLQEMGYDVVVTGGPGEDYQYIMIDHMRRIPIFVAAGSVSVRELAALMGCTQLVVSNSTGPLHIAVALEVPTVSIYSPIPTCHPRRWGPYPAYPEGDMKHRVCLAPDQGLEGANMDLVSVEEVLAACQQQLAAQEERKPIRNLKR